MRANSAVVNELAVQLGILTMELILAAGLLTAADHILFLEVIWYIFCLLSKRHGHTMMCMFIRVKCEVNYDVAFTSELFNSFTKGALSSG